MKVRDIIANFVMPTDTKWDDADWDTLCGMENHYDYNHTKFAGSVKEHFISSWICTDTRVGLSVITLHGEIVAMGWQSARKSGKQVDYVSKEAFEKLKAFMVSCLTVVDHYDILDMDQEIEFYDDAETTNLKES